MRRRRVTAAERRLWRTVMKDALPLSDDETEDDDVPEPPPQPPKRTRRGAVESPVPSERAREALGTAPQNLDWRKRRDLRRGRIRIDGRLDLHGLTVEGAHRALHSFIIRSRQEGRRCVLVITGKGGRRRAEEETGFMPDRNGPGILRRQVPFWLAEPGMRGHVIASETAQPRHGGEGALYVFLRKPSGG